jgi:rSAM/selenodomain-associated transferase 2
VAISIIIPTLDEAGCIAETIRSLRVQEPLEIIVVDGGSTDATAKGASAADRFIISRPGRALQMNAGAAAASGDVLLFLHADCRLEQGSLPQAERLLKRRSVVAGCFRMSVDARGFVYRCIEFSATARVRLTGLAYGDQGLYLRRDLFKHLGGFPPIQLMEDVYFSRRLLRCGSIGVARSRIFVSPRRWQRVGVWRQTLRNWSLLTRFLCGVHPDRLATRYPVIR